MRTLVKSAIAAGIAAGCMSSGAQAADYEQEIGLIVAGAVENWNGISFIDGGSTGSDTTIVSGHSGRVSLPLGPNLSLQSDIDVEWNSRAFAGDDNSAAGNIWNFQGGAHLSWRDPSRSLFGIFAAAGEERHNDTDPDINYDFTVIGGEAQFYIDNTNALHSGRLFRRGRRFGERFLRSWRRSAFPRSGHATAAGSTVCERRIRRGTLATTMSFSGVPVSTRFGTMRPSLVACLYLSGIVEPCVMDASRALRTATRRTTS
jgi:hypothetical protein